LRTSDPLWTIFLHGLGHIQHAATPFYTSTGVFCSIAAIGIFHIRKRFVYAAKIRIKMFGVVFTLRRQERYDTLGCTNHENR
jgi:hypothetical protein